MFQMTITYKHKNVGEPEGIKKVTAKDFETFMEACYYAEDFVEEDNLIEVHMTRQGA